MSHGTFILYNGDETYSLDNKENITVTAPTDIRFILAPINGVQCRPVGISLHETGLHNSDPIGARHFPTREIANGALVIHDNYRDVGRGADTGSTSFVYHVIFQCPDGQVHTLDGGTPTIHNN